jgi:C_GCAxxG_C_C family probable redox protein
VSSCADRRVTAAPAPEVHETLRLLSPATRGTDADWAELRAASLYESGHWCGESVLRTINELAPDPMPPGVARLASGFCEGFGGSRCTCGALAGAVMAAGLLCGRESADDAWEPVYDFAGELRARFVADQHADTCEGVVAQVGEMGAPERWAHCATLVGSCARWVVEIAQEQGTL